jgi:[ribosomal protein S5]-alanine N-acetyltransferase
LIEARDGTGAIGMIGVTPDEHRATIGYVIARRSWGHGLATEAAHEVMRALLEVAGFERVWAVCDVENGASARVLEKIGMRFEGVLARWMIHPNRSAEPRDCRSYAIVRAP